MEIGLGLDVGGTKILACAVNGVGDLVAETRVESPRTPDLLLDALVQATEAILGLLGSDRDSVVGVGVGVPSLVAADGAIYSSPNLPALEGLALHSAFSETLAAMSEGSDAGTWRFVLDNDATCAAAGEVAFGAARGESDVVVVTLGTGIGGGIVAGGRILRGANGFSGEFGHMVVDPAGPPCHCGRRGCFEQVASGSALARLARDAARNGRGGAMLSLVEGDVEALRGEHVLAAARAGDDEALDVFDELAGNLASGIANIVEMLDPARVIIGGGLAGAGSILLTPTVAAFSSCSRRGRGAQAAPLVLAELGERAGAFGAAALGLGIL